MSRQIILNYLEIENFKGIGKYRLPLDGKSIAVTGENESKKTTIKDAFNWLLFDKSSDGKPSSGKGHFGLRPHDRRGKDVRSLVVAVTAEMVFDGVAHILRKEQTEKLTKSVITGYPNQYYIDGAPLLKKDFDKFLAEYISEDTFRLLTDVFYFCGALHHSKRREILVKFAKDAKPPEGYEGLLGRANGRKLDDYLKALTFQLNGTDSREGYESEQKKIPTRVEEILIGIQHPDFDVKEREEARELVTGDIQILKLRRRELREKETDHQDKLGEVNKLNLLLTKRESALASDMSAVQDLLADKQELLEAVQKAKELAIKANSAIEELEAQKTQAATAQSLVLSNLNNIRDDIKKYEGDIKTTCSLCKQTLPANEIKATKKIRKERVDELEAEAKAKMKEVELSELTFNDLDAKILEAESVHDKAIVDMHDLTINANTKLDEITEEIKASPTPPPDEDESWIQITKDIKKAEKLIGEPVTEQLNKLDAEQEVKQSELDKIKEGLAQATRIEADKQRIAVLELREKDLAQLIADIDKEVALIKEYKHAYSRIIESAVNDKFKHTTFKLFDIQINGEIDDRVCEATNNGTAWPDMSMGQSILVGADVVRTLSEELYGIRPPLFIDNAQDLTHPIETNTQTIKLITAEGVKELQVTDG